MTSENTQDFHQAIPFEHMRRMEDENMRHREEAKDLAEADGQIAINMVLDLKREVSETQERNRKAMYWRLFAGICEFDRSVPVLIK